MTKYWSKIRAIYYKLRRKDIRYVYVPTKAGYKHIKDTNEWASKGMCGDDFEHILWNPPKVPEIGTWVVDKNNFVVSEIEKSSRTLVSTDNLYPFKPRTIKNKSVRETIISSLAEVKEIKNV